METSDLQQIKKCQHVVVLWTKEMITFFLISKDPLFTEVKFSCRKIIKISHCVEPLIYFLHLEKVE